MDQFINDNGTVTVPGSEWLALLFFAAAWYLNRRLEGNRWSPYLVLPVAIIGSLMWYASTWSATVCGWLGSFMTGVGSVFGSESVPVATIFGVVCILAVIGTFADLIIDSTYNVGAVWALIIAPVAAHGAAGGIGAFMHGAYGGITLGVVEMLSNVFGG